MIHMLTLIMTSVALAACSSDSSPEGSGETTESAATQEGGTVATVTPTASPTASPTTDKPSESGGTTEASGAPVSRTVSATGVILLDSSVAGDTDELTPGQPVSGATVFVKGYDDQTATTGPSGSFSIEVDVGDGATLTTDTYSIVMWYTTTEDSLKFGVQKDAEIALNGEADLGSVSLGYTKQAKIQLKDELDQDIDDYATECTVIFVGYETKIAVKEEFGELVADYLPPAAYTIRPTCPGFVVEDHSFDFPATAASGTGEWEPVEVQLTAE